MTSHLPKGNKLPMWREPRNVRPGLANLGERIQPYLRDPVTFIQGFCTWEGEPIRLDAWQVAFLRRKQRFRAFEKSVQIGFSWICAAEAFHRAFVFEDDQSSFVSISENEAKNKVHYVAKLHEEMEPWLRELVSVPTKSKEEIWFGTEGRASVIRSLPASGSLRGRATHVYIDEIDFFRPGQDQDVFTAAIGRVTRARRRLTIGSSVFGEETTLSGIMRRGEPGEPNQYPDFLKAKLPWFVSENEGVLESIVLARRNMPPEDFAQEYECQRTTLLDSMFPQDFIRQHLTDRNPKANEELSADGNYAAGYDPGGSIHPAVLTVFDSPAGTWEQVVLEEIRGKSLTDQQQLLEKLLARCQGMTLAIDPGGLGKQMSEHLEDRFGARVIPVNFSPQSKYELAVGIRTALERGDAHLMRDRDLAHQLNRTRRLSGGRIEQPSMGKRTHYDQFWATGLALHAAIGETTSIYDTRGMLSLDMDEGSLSAISHDDDGALVLSSFEGD